ncbi:hypothetical protein AKJ16_DCAP00503 [Drosera capensis]
MPGRGSEFHPLPRSSFCIYKTCTLLRMWKTPRHPDQYSMIKSITGREIGPDGNRYLLLRSSSLCLLPGDISIKDRTTVEKNEAATKANTRISMKLGVYGFCPPPAGRCQAVTVPCDVEITGPTSSGGSKLLWKYKL